MNRTRLKRMRNGTLTLMNSMFQNPKPKKRLRAAKKRPRRMMMNWDWMMNLKIWISSTIMDSMKKKRIFK